jgi:hypothetical protein
MKKQPPTKTPRRSFLRNAALLSGAASFPLIRRAEAETRKPKFLLIIGATGGASIVDSFLATAHQETANFASLNTFPNSEVVRFDSSPFRAVDSSRPTAGPFPFPFQGRQSEFVRKHQKTMGVVTLTGTSVNHSVGQRRSITGNEAWKGRTLQECAALEYGQGFPIPNVNMASDGFAERGQDRSIPERCVGQIIAQPSNWALGLHGSKGILDTAPADLIVQARRLRDGKIAAASPFLQAFSQSPALRQWSAQVLSAQRELEGQALLEKLCMLPPSKTLTDYGIALPPEASRIRELFPLVDSDPFEAQAALAYLLFRNRVSVSATIWPTSRLLVDVENSTLINPPLAFDYSHGSHRDMQAVMWSRVLSVIDRLISLLSETPFENGGESLWDRTLIYVATEFGRTRNRVAGQLDFGTSHDLNNGVLLVSPMIRGNTVFGGVDKDTTLTYGFDLKTGEPDKSRHTSEAEVFSGILDVLGVDTSGSGLPSVTCLRKK